MKSPHITILQHAPGSPPGTIIDWIKAKGLSSQIVRMDLGEPLPSAESVDRLVVMGGPMNVDDVDIFPWLKEEKLWIQAVIEKNKPIIGICLGAQLLSQILGGNVIQNKHWEAGWHVVKLQNLEGAPGELTVFQWHQDTFSIPLGATRFATNEVTSNQGFIYQNVIGFQFHPEADENWVRKQAFEKKYPRGPYVQEPSAVLEGLVYQPAMKDWFFQLLDQRLG